MLLVLANIIPLDEKSLPAFFEQLVSHSENLADTLWSLTMNLENSILSIGCTTVSNWQSNKFWNGCYGKNVHISKKLKIFDF